MDRFNKNDYGTVFGSHEDDDDDTGEDGTKNHGADPLVGRMLKTRTILLSGEVNKDLAERTIRQILLLDDMGTGPIQIFIDSPGGDADAGYAIFDMIRFIKAPVWTIGMGLVASAAAIIQLASPRERRFGLPNSHYLIHQPLSGIRGVATDIEIHARELEKLREKINRHIAGETGIPYEQVEKDTDRDYWMNAGEAVQYGLISQVVVKQAELNLPPVEKPEAQKAPENKTVPNAGAESPAKKKAGR
jgi:ATP-dependent Clp protease protease subunit